MSVQTAVKSDAVKFAINGRLTIGLESGEGIAASEPSYVTSSRKQEKYRGVPAEKEQHLDHERGSPHRARCYT
jgi:hypothetical protein